MASLVASTGARALVGYMAVLALCLACRQIHAQQADTRQAAEITFDLPSQPLKQALAQYDAQTNLSVFFPSELADGRTSTAVHGSFSPEAALRRLLEGTGLNVRAAAADAFVLVPAPQGSHPAAAPPIPAMPRQYDGLVQSRVYQALCERKSLALGDYRLALHVQLAPSGHVQEARLLDTTGNKARDAAIVETVERVDLGQPPSEPARAFVLLVKPVRCAAGAGQADACRLPCGRQANR
ncbi:secretin and TonB N-terminal domain-containing protein [Cupriavidus basilensis]|uniref:Secretin and TonB N-terminal domain-containing protein n=1 Tax=Cupriavidus basilensis TaxID=68895 RepID=A0ABT6AU90_9BURK|nr:secretin and TonB N-terminal domain-containing protein [Cupriavidus basilensis]MDF3835948.1 secretin and TonB N-terminal domain-containing protein [Cupriavidus basilensis]